MTPAAVGRRTRLMLTFAAAVVAAAAWFPLIAEHPQSWDEIQYMLGVREYDLEKHQPHPPGYYLHEKAAALITLAGLQERTALIVLSMAAGALTVALVVWWAGGEGGAWAAVAAGVLAITSPLLAMAATEARTYMTGALGVTVVGYLSYLMVRGEGRWAVPTGIALGLTAGFRPTAAAFIAPLWLWALTRCGARTMLVSGLAAAAASLAWAVPFLSEIGGLPRFLEISGRLGGPVADRSPLQSGGLKSLTVNLSRTGTGLLLLLGVGLPGLVIALQASRRSVPWLLLWTLPALCFFILMHTGTPLYVMVFAAPLLVLASVGLAHTIRSALRPAGRLMAIAVLVLVHALFIDATVMQQREAVDAQVNMMSAALAPLADGQAFALTMLGREPEAADGYLAFRHAGYILPETSVQIFPLEAAGPAGTMPNSMYRNSTGLIKPPLSIVGRRRILLLGSGLRAHLPPDRPCERVFEGAWTDVWQVDLHEDEVVTLAADGLLLINPPQ